MIDTERLIRKAAAYGIDAAPVVRKLDEYAALLVEYNQKVNLTAITDAEGIEDRHFIDSLLLAARPEVCGRMVDVGTGAGFPGIVAKLFRPELDLTLMEPTGKRVDFLKYAGRQDVTLPDGSARTLILYEKISQTPPVYPRNGGKIAKAPLK